MRRHTVPDLQRRKKDRMRRYVLSLAAGLLASAAVPGVAAAATDAVTTTELNMRAGPSTSYPVVEVLPDNAEVTVYGCVGDYAWCDVSWQSARGWVAASYLSSYTNSRYVPIIEYGPTIGLPVVDFVFDSYWDTYYPGRSWYGNRARWRNYWRDHRRDRREDRAERREDRRDAKAERRENRVEQRQDRRQDRAERREDRRDARSDRRRDRVQQNRRSRDARAQQRGERRVERRERARGARIQRRDARAQRQAPRRQMQSRGPGRSVQRGGGGGRDVQRGGGGGRSVQRGGGDRRRGG